MRSYKSLLLIEYAAKFVGVFAVIGLFFGAVVLTSFGMQYNVVPSFSGDEWVPQLAALAFFCGFFSAAVFAMSTSDIWMHRATSLGRANFVGPPRPSVAGHSWRDFGQEVFLGAFWIALIAVSAKFYKLPSFIVVLGPILCVTGLRLGFQQPNHALLRTWPARVERFWMSFVSLFSSFFVVWILIEVLVGRFLKDDELKFFAMAIVVAAAVAAYRMLVSWMLRTQADAGQTSVLISGITLLFIAVTFAPEIVRAANMGNLSAVNLLMDADHACVVAARVNERKKVVKSTCPPASSPMPGSLVQLELDVVSRFGSTYTLASTGQLDAGLKCAPISGRRKAVEPQRYMTCIDLPREAIKDLYRPEITSE